VRLFLERRKAPSATTKLTNWVERDVLAYIGPVSVIIIEKVADLDVALAQVLGVILASVVVGRTRIDVQVRVQPVLRIGLQVVRTLANLLLKPAFKEPLDGKPACLIVRSDGVKIGRTWRIRKIKVRSDDVTTTDQG